MKNFYDQYWSHPAPGAARDPLMETRHRLLWSSVETGSTHKIRLLDCGAGSGKLVAEATAKGHEALGMDISRVGLERAQRLNPGSKFIEHDLQERPWPTPRSRFDVVVAFEVIEHLFSPGQLIAGAREALLPGGHLALTTPYHGRLKNAALAMAAFDRHFAVEGEHIRFFTDASLQRLLKQSGFRIEHLRHFGRFWRLWAGVYIWARRQ